MDTPERENVPNATEIRYFLIVPRQPKNCVGGALLLSTGYWELVAGMLAHWKLGYWVLGTGYWVPVTGVLYTGVPGTGYWGTGYWALGPVVLGCSDTGCWVLGTITTSLPSKIPKSGPMAPNNSHLGARTLAGALHNGALIHLEDSCGRCEKKLRRLTMYSQLIPAPIRQPHCEAPLD